VLDHLASRSAGADLADLLPDAWAKSHVERVGYRRPRDLKRFKAYATKHQPQLDLLTLSKPLESEPCVKSLTAAIVQELQLDSCSCLAALGVNMGG
jgi:hypothetical protein